VAERAARVRFVLASGSAGRLKVLRDAGIDAEVVVSDVDESDDDGLQPADLVQRLAERKAAAVARMCPGALVLGCDSLLEYDGTALGKPRSGDEALAMLRRLAGQNAALLTGHCLVETRTGRQVTQIARTVIRFGTPHESELEAYVASGEPMALAGGFSIEGRGAPFVDGIDGDASNVIGLSLPLLRRMLADLGLAITDLWRPVTRPAG
jgi:nucleoside triphosphate pyrophosphatase